RTRCGMRGRGIDAAARRLAPVPGTATRQERIHGACSPQHPSDSAGHRIPAGPAVPAGRTGAGRPAIGDIACRKSFHRPNSTPQERAGFPARAVVDLQALQRSVHERYRNQVVVDVNDACLRMSVLEGEYRWHLHPGTDELFLVIEGELHIEFADRPEAVLDAWQCLVVPA